MFVLVVRFCYYFGFFHLPLKSRLADTRGTAAIRMNHNRSEPTLRILMMKISKDTGKKN